MLKGKGFPATVAKHFVAIAMNESGLDPSYRCKTCLGVAEDSYGLFQINLAGNLGVERMRAYGIRRKSDLYRPEESIRVAYLIWKDYGLEPWSINNRMTVPPLHRQSYASKHWAAYWKVRHLR